MTMRMYPMETKCTKSFCSITCRWHVLARSCFPLLSIILCIFFMYKQSNITILLLFIAPASNMEFQVKFEYVKDEWSHLVSAAIIVPLKRLRTQQVVARIIQMKRPLDCSCFYWIHSHCCWKHQSFALCYAQLGSVVSQDTYLKIQSHLNY